MLGALLANIPRHGKYPLIAVSLIFAACDGALYGLTSGIAVATATLMLTILPRVTIHALAHASLATLRDKARLIILRDEIVEVVVGLQNHAAAASAVAAARPTLGDVGLAMERDAAFAAVPCLRVNFYFVNEHEISLP